MFRPIRVMRGGGREALNGFEIEPDNPGAGVDDDPFGGGVEEDPGTGAENDPPAGVEVDPGIGAQVDNFNDPFAASSITYTIETDRRNISSYFRCFPGYMHFSVDQIKKIYSTTVNHRAPVTTFRQIPIWRNKDYVAITHTNEFPGVAISEISVTTSECTAKKTTRLTVGVDITHPRGGLYIQLESPDGYLYSLHKPGDNAVDGFRVAGGLKTLFYFNVKNGSVFKDGVWKLMIYEGSGQTSGPHGVLNEWQIQFADDNSSLVTEGDAANCANATRH